MSAPVIDTLDVLGAAHRMYTEAVRLEQSEPEESRRIARIADAGFSAVIPYLRNRKAPVQKKHFEAMTNLLEAEKGLK